MTSRKKRAMLSQPMGGKTPKEIEAARDGAVSWLEAHGYEVVNTLFTDEMYEEFTEGHDVRCPPLMYLAESIRNMSLCDAAYFVAGWEAARGCRIERRCAEDYGLTIIEEGE